MKEQLLLRLRTLICLGLILLGAMNLRAQSPSEKLEGVVLDQQGKPIAYVSVALLRGDSTTLGGGVTNAEGRFSLTKTEEAKLLRFSYVGYIEQYMSIEDFRSPIHLEPKTRQLGEVEVRAKRPELKLSKGELVLDVVGTELALRSDIWEVLSAVPGLRASQEEGARLLSGGKLLILIDGREVQSLSQVQALDPKKIKSVKLNNSPSARYRGNISAVLNIETQKPKAGIYLLGSHTSRVNHRYSHSEQAEMGYTTPKAHYSAHLNIGNWKALKLQEITSRTASPSTGGNEERVETSIRDDNTSKGAELLSSADFTLSPKLSLGAKLNATRAIYASGLEDRSHVFTGATLHDDLLVETDARDKKDSYHLNAYADYKLKPNLTLGLTADAVLKKQNRKQESEETHLLLSGSTPFEIETKVDNQLYQLTPYLRYTWQGGKTLELGAELQSISSASQQWYDHNLRNEYSNDERLLAGFAQYSQMLSPMWQAQIGLRYEYAESQLKDKLRPSAGLSRHFSNLFYNAQLSGRIGRTMHTLSLKTSIDRPSLSQLSNNTFRSSAYLLQEGNPFLKPQRNLNLAYSLVYGILYLAAEYHYRIDPIEQYLYANPPVPGGYIFSSANYDEAHSLSLTANATKQWSWYKLQATGYFNYQKVAGFSFQGLDIRVRPLYYFKLSQSFLLPKETQLRLEYSYTSDATWSIFEIGKKHELNFYATKSFLKGRLQVSLSIRDILANDRALAYTKLGNLSLDHQGYEDNRSIRLKLTYRLNKERAYKGKDSAREGINRL